MAVLVVWFFGQNEKLASTRSQALVSGASAVSQKLAHSALVPQEDGGEEEEKREGADEEANKGKELQAEGQTRTQRL